jgi:DNA-binding CsgD family transcriptional regulator/tetratricopeptide (TPR) repeat protein
LTDTSAAAHGLLERSGELGRIDAGLAALGAGGGGVLLVEGAAGIGKSRLLARAVEAARGGGGGRRPGGGGGGGGAAGSAAPTARGRELESGFAFGVVRQLLERELRDSDPGRRERLLAGAAGLAAPLIEPGGAVPAEGGQSFPLFHGLYWTLANLAEERPLLLAVDDAHWADAASLGLLAFLAPRLDELPVLLLVTTRPRGAEEAPLLAALSREPATEKLRPRPLSAVAVAELASEGLGAAVEPSFAGACREVTGGNPFLLGELLAELAAERIDPVATAAPRVLAIGPEGVGRVVLADLARLGPAAPPLARATAVLEEARLEDAAALAEIDLDAARASADELAAAGILEGDLTLRFRHALVRNAVYADLHAQARAELHRRAAVLLAAHPAGAGADAAAAHLLRCAPAADPSATAQLLDAADRAFGRGSPGAAADFLRRAAEEPPPPERRGEVLRLLGRAEALAGDAGAVARYEEALPLLAEPGDRADAIRELATIYAMQAGASEQARAVATLEQGLAALDGDDPRLRVALECDLVCFARIGTGLDPRVEAHVERLRALAEEGWEAGTPIGRRVLVRAAYDTAIAAEPTATVRALLDPALADGSFASDEPVESAHFPVAAFTLMATDDYDGAEALLGFGMSESQARGSAVGFSQASGYRAIIGLKRGLLAEAEADARAGLAAAQLPESTPLLVACLVDALLEQGRLAEAELLLAEQGMDEATGRTHFFLHLLEARGRLRLAAGEVERALVDLEAAVAVQEHLDLDNPAMMSSRSSAARALLTLGRAEEAAALAAAELGPARGFGAPRAIGVALAVLGSAVGGEEGTVMLREAVGTLAGSGAELQLARAQVDLGAALRRAGARAEEREHLRAGLDGAERCGAAPLVGRAREELLASGARPRRNAAARGAGSLTASELRVARMAAEGLSNPEIAQRLFVTRKTVEVHLSHAYRKLEIASRDGLGEALAKD